jgi:hypothetical protein
MNLCACGIDRQDCEYHLEREDDMSIRAKEFLEDLIARSPVQPPTEGMLQMFRVISINMDETMTLLGWPGFPADHC